MKSKVAHYQIDGLYLIKRGDRYFIHGTHDGERIRIGTKTDSLPRAKAKLEEFIREKDSGWRVDSSIEATTTNRQLATITYAKCRTQARARGIPFHIKTSDIYDLMVSTNFRCAVSGIEFSRKPLGPGVPDPWAASVDRIENRQGYTPDNIRVVCLLANIGMNRWGYDALLRLSKAVVNNAACVAAEPSFILTQNLIPRVKIDDKLLINNEKAA